VAAAAEGRARMERLAQAAIVAAMRRTSASTPAPARMTKAAA
jgi:hypothetical protein